MYSQIKAAAEAAINLQNKNEMEAALKRIVAMCNEGIVKNQLADSVTLASAPGGFGLANVKTKGGSK